VIGAANRDIPVADDPTVDFQDAQTPHIDLGLADP
jgi:hypothetical protein